MGTDAGAAIRFIYPEKDFRMTCILFILFPADKADAGKRMLLKNLLSGSS
jgi:hypothetical protein